MINRIKTLINLFKIKAVITSKDNFSRGGSSEHVVLINTVRPILYPFLLERFLGLILAEAGATVYQTIDDGCLRHWDSSTLNQDDVIAEKKWSSLYRRFSRIGLALASRWICHERLHTVQLSDVLKSADCDAIDYSHVLSSCRRYTSKSSFWSDLESQKYYKDTVYNSTLWESSADIILDQFSPNIVISSHGIYSTWGVLHDAARERGIKTIVFSKCPYKSNSVWLTDSAFQKISADKRTFERLDSVEKLERAADFFSERFSRLSPDSAIFYGNETISSQGAIVGSANSTATTFVMFPNVAWDGAIEERNVLFDSILEWVIATIKAVAASENHLIIRFHPSETTMFKGSETFEELLDINYPEYRTFANVEIVPSSVKLDSYDLIQGYADVVLVYDGLIALESTYLNKPTISCAKTRYESAGFSFHPANVNDYLAILDGSDSKDFQRKFLDESKRDALLSFTHWYIYDLVYQFPLINFTDQLSTFSDDDFRFLAEYRGDDLVKRILSV